MLVCILYNFIDREQQHSVFKKLGFVFKLYVFFCFRVWITVYILPYISEHAATAQIFLFGVVHGEGLFDLHY